MTMPDTPGSSALSVAIDWSFLRSAHGRNGTADWCAYCKVSMPCPVNVLMRAFESEEAEVEIRTDLWKTALADAVAERERADNLASDLEQTQYEYGLRKVRIDRLAARVATLEKAFGKIHGAARHLVENSRGCYGSITGGLGVHTLGIALDSAELDLIRAGIDVEALRGAGEKENDDVARS
jgi:hypothetical protein